MNYTKLLKLIFFADKLHLKKYGSLITDDKYFAMPKGPVASLTYNIVKNSDDLELDSLLPFEKDKFNLKITNKISNYDCLSQTEIDDLTVIYQTFGELTPRQLIEITHNCKERSSLKEIIESRKSIPMEIEMFFEDSQGQNDIFNIPEYEVALAKDLYHERCEYAI